MPFAGNLRTLPLPDVFQTLNNIKATGVLRLRSNAGSRDVVFQQGEIIGVGFLDKEGREDLPLRIELLGITMEPGERLRGATWYYTAMEARNQTQRAELDELIHDQAREQLHNLFAWNTAEFAFDESGPGKTIANELVAHSLERPLAIDTATILLEAARQQDEWAELRTRIRDEAGVAAMGSSPTLGVQEPEGSAEPATEDSQFHLYLEGEWRGPYPRSQIVGLVQTGEIPSETWSYDPRTQDRKTLDQLLGSEARRITPNELESLRQAVHAADNRLSEERAGRAADLAELRGLASEVLRLARDCQLSDPSIGAVVERLAEVANGDDPSIVALAAETVIVALVRHLRELGQRDLGDALDRVSGLEKRILATDNERAALEAQLAEAERRTDAERDAASVLREHLSAAADDASRLDQELERSKRDPSRASTARISDLRSPEDIALVRTAGGKGDARAAELQREIGRMRADHARLLNEVATLQARLDEERSRHEAELEASRALAGSLSERQDPPTEAIGKATQELHAVDATLVAEVAKLKRLLAEGEAREKQSETRKTAAERDRAAAERDNARGDTERLRRDLHAARTEAARATELAKAGEHAEARIAVAEAKAANAGARATAAEQRVHAAETALGEARERLEQAEAARREQDRAAYEAARQNTQLQVRLHDLAARMEDGEARLKELGDLSAQLIEARSRADALEAEASRIRADFAAVREAATGKLDRAKRRVDELRDRLRASKRDRNAAVPWSSPMTAAFTSAPQQPQAQVPWPSPATATHMMPQGQAPVPWPSPATAAWGPQGSWPMQQPMPMPQQAQNALSPNGSPEAVLGASFRTTSGTFVPMPMPDDSSAGRPRVHMPTPALPAPEARAWPPAARWGSALAACLTLGVGLLWWGATSAVPICERAIVNGRLVEVVAPIAGTVRELQVRDGQQVTAGTRLAKLWNDELNRSSLDALRQQELALKSRIQAQGETLRLAQQTHDRLIQEMAATPPAPAPALATPATATTPTIPAASPLPDPRERLRQEFAARIVEITGNLDDVKAQLAENEVRRTSEERRLDSLRQADLIAPIDGIVHIVPGANESFAAGRQVFSLIDSSSLVIDAELPADARLAIGDPAFVRFGNDQVEATVQQINPSANETRRLALAPTVSAGAVRVLLVPRNPSSVLDRFQGQARIAFPGAVPGVFSWLGLKLRF